MIEHIITVAAAKAPAITGGHILGTVGAGGIAVAATGGLILGIRKPKNKGGKGEGSAQRNGLNGDGAVVVGGVAGTFYSAAGNIWNTPEDASLAIARVFTDGGFGSVGLGGVALLMGAAMYFRRFQPRVGALMGISGATIWAQAGGIWGIPSYLIVSLAQSLGLV